MLLVCPSCATSYEVQAAALGAAGRSVRCVRCRSVWFANPPLEALVAPATGGGEGDASEEAVTAFRAELGEAPAAPASEEPMVAWEAPVEGEVTGSENQEPAEPAPDAAAGADAAAEAAGASDGEMTAAAATEPAPDIGEVTAPAIPDIPSAEVPPLSPVQVDPTLPPPTGPLPPEPPEDIETVAARRARRDARRRRRLRPGLPMLILMLIGVIATLIVWRGEVVRHVPQMASLYASIGLPVNLRGLVFADVKTTRDTHDGVTVMVVEGTITNPTSVQIEVPRLRFAVRNEFGNEIYSWTAQPTQTVLPPGEKLPFRSRLASPPTESRAVVVRFFTRRDAVAGLR